MGSSFGTTGTGESGTGGTTWGGSFSTVTGGGATIWMHRK